MKVLITGGAGFIGSHLSERLVSSGNQVSVLDNLFTGKIENLASIINNPLFSIIEKDVRQISANDTKDTDVVIHLAAIANVQKSIDDPTLTHDVNVNGTLAVLEACRLSKVKKVIFGSSAAVYGNAKNLPVDELTELKPNTPYGLHKLIGEQYVNLYTEIFGLQTIVFRFFNVYGDRQSNTGYAGLIAALNKCVKNDEDFNRFGDGEQTRDFIHVSDIVSAISIALNHDQSLTCNLGTGLSISVNKAIAETEKTFDKKITVVNKPARDEIKNSCADIKKANSELNWQPKINFAEGLKLL